jgi:predicted permease
MLHDIRLAFLALRRHPTFTALTVLTLGLAIGATVAVFCVVESVLLKPLPFPDADRLVILRQRTTAEPTGRLIVPALEVPELRGGTGVLQGVGVQFADAIDVTVQAGGGVPEHAVAQRVSYDYLSVLGVRPIVGRTFARDDAVPSSSSGAGAAQSQGTAVVLNQGYWQRAFGSDPAVLDQAFSIQGRPAHVVGVLPRTFSGWNGDTREWVAGKGVDMFVAMPEQAFTYAGPRPGPRTVVPTARLKPGVTYDQARAALEVMAARLRNEYPAYAEEDMHYTLKPMEEAWRARYRPVLRVLAGGAVFLLLLVSANVANLTLVRSWTRSGEDAMRMAVGCGRTRLAVQKLVESLLMALGGSVVGLGVAWAAIRVLGTVAPASVPVLHEVRMNALVVVACVALSAVLVGLFALIPVAQVHRLDLRQVLNSEGRGTGGRRSRRVMNGLVVAELALSMVLLTGAAIMVRSLYAMTKVNTGYRAKQVLTFDTRPYSQESYRSAQARAAVYAQAEERLLAVPGVEALGRTTMLPFSDKTENGVYASDPERLAGSTDRTNYILATDGYFQAMGNRLLMGRVFTRAEGEDRTSSIIVDENVANIAWPGQTPLGKRLHWRWGGNTDEGTVVGVVEHMLMTDIGSEYERWGAVFLPEGHFGGQWIAGGFAVRTSLPADRIAPSIRRALLEVDPSFVPYDLQKLSDRVALSMAPTRFVVMTMTAFAVLALLVALVGLFGVISYTVRTRTTELGIRMALGAGRPEIMTMVLRQGAFLSAAGVVGGIVGALALGRFMRSMVFGLSATDPFVLAATALALAMVSLLASWAPARWACRVDPARVLDPTRKLGPKAAGTP